MPASSITARVYITDGVTALSGAEVYGRVESVTRIDDQDPADSLETGVYNRWTRVLTDSSGIADFTIPISTSGNTVYFLVRCLDIGMPERRYPVPASGATWLVLTSGG